MMLNESRLTPLFRKQETLAKDSEEYIANRSLIMQEVVKQLRREFKNYPNFWANKHGIDYADGQSLIYMGLLRAIDLFQPSRGKCKFNSFMWTVISQTFLNHKKLAQGQKKTPPLGALDSLDEVLRGGVEKGRDMDLEEVTNAEPITPEPSYNAQFLYSKMLVETTPLQKQIIELVKTGYNVSAISKQLGVTTRIIKREFKILKRRYEKHS